MNKVEEFKAFVKDHPLLKDEVKNKIRTWQNIYEEWFFDNSDSSWSKYKKKEEIKQETKDKEEEETVKASSTDEMLKTIMGYVKKVNPDTINKSIDSIQKIMGLFSSFGAGATASTASQAKKKTGDPLFDRRFDDWY